MVVFYNWDNAWGYNPYADGPLANTLGALNPLRYRSYVYDSETGYYYLQSRYYDPEIGRFINADGYVSTGQGFIGNNMFAYCNNNPVNLLDPTGTVCCAIFGDNQLLHLNMQVYFSRGGGSYASGGISGKGHYISMKEFLDTDDPEVVFANLDTCGIAYYNGVLVLQVNFGNGGGLSLGIILLDDNYKYDKRGINALNHEYGHRLHMDDIGVVNYLVTTAIPSFLGATLKTLKVTDVHYYSLPWEYVADFYGGVNRPGYEAWANQAGARFLLYTLIVGSITDSITDMFTGGIR
jgi:RHS repeat-associated protein